MQNDDGGWPWWRRGDESQPFVSVQVAHALVVAEGAGYRVPPDTLARALDHVANIEQHLPADFPEPERDAVRAYALWVSELAGRPDQAKAAEMFADRGDELQVDAIAWLWGSLEGADREEARRLIGMVSERDLLTVIDVDGDRVLENLKRQVKDVMTSPVVASIPVTDIRRIAAAMLEGGLSAVPIVNESEHIVGIVSRADILRAVMTDPPLSLWR